MNQKHPLHLFHFCPKCGSASFRELNSRAKQCDACHFIYFFNSSGAVAALIETQAGELVVVRRAFAPGSGLLDLPGGFIDPGETAEQALIREVKEELGGVISNLKYVTSYANSYPFSGFEVATIDLLFRCSIEDARHLKPMDDVSEIILLPKGEVDLSLFAFESMRNCVSYWLKDK